MRVFFSVAVRYLAGVIVVAAVGGRVVPSVLGVMAADSHHEKLFAELVASALRQKMDDDWTEWQLPESSSTLARVSELEAAVVEIRGDVADIKSHIVLMAQALGVLPAKQPIILAPMQQPSLQQQLPYAAELQQHASQQFVGPQDQHRFQPPVMAATREQLQFKQPIILAPMQQPSLQQQLPYAAELQQHASQQFVGPQDQHRFQPPVMAASREQLQSSSDSSAPTSPKVGYAFRCPICTNPQYNPKSHCNHMRKIANGGGYCHFRDDVPFHVGILRCHGSVPQFVSWYTQRMRSSMGPQYTDDDITDYEQTQSQLRSDVASEVLYGR